MGGGAGGVAGAGAGAAVGVGGSATTGGSVSAGGSSSSLAASSKAGGAAAGGGGTGITSFGGGFAAQREVTYVPKPGQDPQAIARELVRKVGGVSKRESTNLASTLRANKSSY